MALDLNRRRRAVEAHGHDFIAGEDGNRDRGFETGCPGEWRARECLRGAQSPFPHRLGPLPRLTGAIHAYGGDFFGVSCSEWHPETLDELPYDMEKVLRMFAQ